MIPALKKLLEFEFKSDESQFQGIPGSKSFFEFIQSKNEYICGIATGSWEASAIIKLKSIEVDPFKVFFSNSNYFKSREDITNSVIDQAKESHPKIDEIYYFGDGVWDYHTCKNIGIDFIGIDYLEDRKLASLGAKHVFKNFINTTALLNIIG